MNIKDYMIADSSNTLLDAVGHEFVGLYDAVERKLKAVGAPEVMWRMETGETSFLRALCGKRRDFLWIEHARLREHVVLIGAHRYGTALHVSWLLLARPRLVNDIRRALNVDANGESRFDIGAELDVFDTLDLDAFLAVTRLALRTAMRELVNTDREEDIESNGLLESQRAE